MMVIFKKNFNYQNLFDIKYYNKINICKVNKVVIDKTILNFPDQDNILPKILHRCKTNKAYPEDMENRASNLLLCDDCYTEIRYLMADYLNIHIQEIKI